MGQSGKKKKDRLTIASLCFEIIFFSNLLLSNFVAKQCEENKGKLADVNCFIPLKMVVLLEGIHDSAFGMLF